MTAATNEGIDGVAPIIGGAIASGVLLLVILILLVVIIYTLKQRKRRKLVIDTLSKCYGSVVIIQ